MYKSLNVQKSLFINTVDKAIIIHPCKKIEDKYFQFLSHTGAVIWQFTVYQFSIENGSKIFYLHQRWKAAKTSVFLRPINQSPWLHSPSRPSLHLQSLFINTVDKEIIIHPCKKHLKKNNIDYIQFFSQTGTVIWQFTVYKFCIETGS